MIEWSGQMSEGEWWSVRRDGQRCTTCTCTCSVGSYMYMRINNETTCCAGFTGIDSSYEPPENPDLVLKASEYTVQECVDKLVGFLQERVWLCCL